MRGHRNLTILALAILLIASAEQLWWGFIPAYLRALGASVSGVAAFGTLQDFLDAIYQFPGGLLTQRLGHRVSLAVFNVVAILGYLAIATAHTWYVVILALPLAMAWQSLSLPATFSMVGNLLPRDRRSVAIAWQSIAKRAPTVFAPALGGAILAAFGVVSGIRFAILAGAAIAACALLLQLTLYRVQRDENQMRFASLLTGAFGLPTRLKRLLICDIFVRFGQGIGEVFIVLYVLQVAGFSTTFFGIMTGLAMATSIAAYLPAAHDADRRGREIWVFITYCFFAAFPLALAFSTSAWMVALAFVAMGLREIGEPPRKAMIVDLARHDRRSVDVGTYYLVRGLCVFPASLVGGALWKFSPSATFIGAALVAALGAGSFLVLLGLRRPAPAEA